MIRRRVYGNSGRAIKRQRRSYGKRGVRGRYVSSGFGSGFIGSGKTRSIAKASLSYNGAWGRYMPEVFYTNMYNAEFWTDTTAGGVVDHVIKCNSIHDPWNALSANSVLGVSNMTAIYAWYRVFSCTIEIELVNNDTDDPVKIYIIEGPTADSYTARGEDLIGMPGAVQLLVPNQAGAGHLRKKIQIGRQLGLLKADTSQMGAMGADPTRLVYAHLIFQNVSGNALNCVAQVRICFRVQLFGLKKASLTQ